MWLCVVVLLFFLNHLLRLRLLIQHGQRSGKLLVFVDLLFQLYEVKKQKHENGKAEGELNYEYHH